MNRGGNFDVEKVSGAYNLSTLFADTFMSEIFWACPSAIFTFGQLRQCTKSRAEVIMSVVGATDWYTEYVSEHKVHPPETDLVLSLSPLAFLAEAAAKIGPTFYTAISTDLHDLSGVVDLSNGNWRPQILVQPIGSMIPITANGTYLLPPQENAFGSYDHPSVKTWIMNRDGSLQMKQAGILRFGIEEIIEKELDDSIQTIEFAAQGSLIYDTELDTLECKDLEEWLTGFENPSSSPNYAVCLYQQIHLTTSVPGPQVGLLLKAVGLTDSCTQLVKIGTCFTRASRVKDFSTKDVDWLVCKALIGRKCTISE